MTRLTEADEFEHSLRNHVAVIIGFAELLLADTPEDDPRHGDLREIQEAARAALALIDRMPAS